jgi:gluconolactonase
MLATRLISRSAKSVLGRTGLLLLACACGTSAKNASDAGGGPMKARKRAPVAMDAGKNDAAADASEGDASSSANWPPLMANQIPEPVEVSNTFTLAEGPIWDHCGHRLLFTDVSARTIHSLDADDKVEIYFSPTNYANGLAFDNDGSLLLAQMGGSSGGRISRLDASKRLSEIVDQEDAGGSPGTNDALSVIVDQDPAGSLLGTTDDLIVRSDGTIYFTDPIFPFGSFTAFSLSPRAVYRLVPGAAPRTLVQEAMVATPNGIELSPDEKTLYVAAYLSGQVLKFSVASGGALKAQDPLVTGLSTPDSLCVDAAGNVYVGVTGGLQVVSADGALVKLIPVPLSRAVTNCTFGAEDGKTLYITAWTSLLKVEGMPIPGLDWKKNQDRIVCPD